MFKKKYVMKDNYNVDDLMVGNFNYVSSNVTEGGIKEVQTDQKYFFEEVLDNGKIKYREIFTGFIADAEENGYFDIPYVVNAIPLRELFQGKDVLSKYALILVLDKVNTEQKVKKNIKR